MTTQQFLDFTGQTRVLSDAFSIYNTSGSNTTATVQVTDTTLVTVGSGTGTDTFTFANAAHDTMAELTAAITALAEGWQVELLSGSGVATGNLVPFAATDAYTQENAITLQYSNTSLIEDWINAASTAIETYLGTPVVAVTDQRYWLDGRGSETLLVPLWPLTSVKRLAYGSVQAFYVQATTSTDLRATVEVQDSLVRLSRVASDGTVTQTDITFANEPTTSDMVTAINLESGWSATLVENCLCADLHRRGGMDAKGVNAYFTFPETEWREYHVDESCGLITLVSGFDGFDVCPPRFPRGKVLAQVDGGYALASVPSDIVTAAWMLALSIQQKQSADLSLQSQSLGQYSEVKNILQPGQLLAMSDTVRGLLDPYKRRGF